MQTGEIRRILLELTGLRRQADAGRLAAMKPSDWGTLQSLAGEHRLEPLLHWLHRDSQSIPTDVRGQWREAYRQSAMIALVQRAELQSCFGLLADAGFAPVALKGSYLAAHAYPEAALRPMRDIDLILPEDQVIPAYETLRAAGYVMADPEGLPLEDVMRVDKHLPIITAPSGSQVELHKRLSKPAGTLDLDAPDVDEAVLMDRAMEIDGIAYPVPEDQLAHLIVHAIYGHRLDCGPLVLTDIAFLTRRIAFDWDCFWQRARREGWDGGAKLLIDMVRELHGAEAIQRVEAEPEPAPSEIRETAPDLLLQRLDTRRSAKAWGALTGGNYRLLLRRVTGRVTAHGEKTVTQDRSASGGTLRWAAREARTVMRNLMDSEVRAQSRNLNAFRQWLRH